MQIKIYQVDAFSDTVFKGNPAAVCILEAWIPTETMQAIAYENNLSETAFFVPAESPLQLRWFTPAVEVDLCGHATLATAHVLKRNLEAAESEFAFNSRSGILKVYCNDGAYTLDFPRDVVEPVDPDLPIFGHFDKPVLEAFRGSTDYLLRVASQADVEELNVEFSALKTADGRGFLVTAPGNDCDYVARCFFPQSGINEDPATGSSQTTLAPYWADKLGKVTFEAKQLSSRGGSFKTALSGERVLITGQAASYMEGVITI